MEQEEKSRRCRTIPGIMRTLSSTAQDRSKSNRGVSFENAPSR